MYIFCGPFINIFVLIYACIYMDSFGWGKTRKVVKEKDEGRTETELERLARTEVEGQGKISEKDDFAASQKTPASSVPSTSQGGTTTAAPSLGPSASGSSTNVAASSQASQHERRDLGDLERSVGVQ